MLKVAVSRDFLAYFSPLIQSIWAPDKQLKMVLQKIRFSWRYLNFKLKNSLLRSVSLRGVDIFLQASPLKS